MLPMMSPISRSTGTLLLGALGALLLPAVAACGGDDPGTTIAEARAEATGAVVTVDGYVSVPPGAFVSAMGDQGFAIQDDTAGVYVKLDDKEPFALGARVRVTGTLDEQNQLRIVKALPADVVKLSGSREVAPRDVGTGAVNEDVEGQLVRVAGNVTQTFQDDSPYGYKLYVNDGSGEVQIFVHVSAGLDRAGLEALAAGQRITVVGFASQYEATYEVAPRQQADLTQ